MSSKTVAQPNASTSAAPGTPAALSAECLPWLTLARDTPEIVLVGTITGPTAGGSLANTVWQSDIPKVSRWASEFDLFIQEEIAVTVPAGGGFTPSRLFPFNSVLVKLKFGGATYFDFISAHEFYLDEITNRVNRDPSYRGIGDASNSGGVSQYQDDGGSQFDLGGLTPGVAVNNTTTASTTTNYTVTYRVKIQLQRFRDNCIGMIPLGDPGNRPAVSVQLAPIVGAREDQSPLQDTGGAGGATFGVTAQTVGSVQVINVIRSKAIDTLEPGQTATPPTVGYALFVNQKDTTIGSANSLTPVWMQENGIYLKVNVLTLAANSLVRNNYFSVWDDESQKTARSEYDASINNFADKFRDYQARYGRYLPFGVDVVDNVGGEDPNDPMLTPYDALMTDSVPLAAIWDLMPTPNMQIVTRLPSGTATTAFTGISTCSFTLQEATY